MSRIGLTGTVSVGKTTLVKALKELPEFKDYKIETEKSKEIRDKGIKLNTDSTLQGQIIFANYRTEELLNKNIISDRTLLDVMAFTRLAKSIPHYICNDYENLYKHLINEYDYIFYISPEGIEIEDNGVRCIDAEYRLKVDKEIQEIISLYKNKIKHYHQISGTTEERIQQIKNIIFNQ